MKTWILEGCPRCNGDLNLEFDFRTYYKCLQCGRPNLTILVKKVENKERVSVSGILFPTGQGDCDQIGGQDRNKKEKPPEKGAEATASTNF